MVVYIKYEVNLWIILLGDKIYTEVNRVHKSVLTTCALQLNNFPK